MLMLVAELALVAHATRVPRPPKFNKNEIFDSFSDFFNNEAFPPRPSPAPRPSPPSLQAVFVQYKHAAACHTAPWHETPVPAVVEC